MDCLKWWSCHVSYRDVSLISLIGSCDLVRKMATFTVNGAGNTMTLSMSACRIIMNESLLSGLPLSWSTRRPPQLESEVHVTRTSPLLNLRFLLLARESLPRAAERHENRINNRGVTRPRWQSKNCRCKYSGKNAGTACRPDAAVPTCFPAPGTP